MTQQQVVHLLIPGASYTTRKGLEYALLLAGQRAKARIKEGQMKWLAKLLEHLI